jgi:hypothetical protein
MSPLLPAFTRRSAALRPGRSPPWRQHCHHRKGGQRLLEAEAKPINPELEASVRAFFARMIRPPAWQESGRASTIPGHTYYGVHCSTVAPESRPARTSPRVLGLRFNLQNLAYPRVGVRKAGGLSGAVFPVSVRIMSQPVV